MSETKGFPPVSLMANSYNFADLLKASDHATGLKDEAKQDVALGELARKTALNQDVLKGQDAPATPEGHEIRKIEDAQGNIVEAPVLMRGATTADEPPADGKGGTKTPAGNGAA